MQTIKTFVVVGLLLAVCYGAFVALNAPQVSIPDELEQWAQSTNDKELLEYEIPTLSMPPTPTQGSAAPELSRSTPNFNDSAPQFPSDNPLPSLSSQQATSALPVSNASIATLPSTISSTQDESSNLLPPSGATLTSIPTAASVPTFPQSSVIGVTDQKPLPELPASSFAQNAAGPSIPFNANSAPTVPTADDLIGAVGAWDTNSSTSADVTLPPADSKPAAPEAGLSQDSGLLASRSDSSSESGDLSPQPSQKSTTIPYSDARTHALQLAEAGELAEALDLLSQYYESPEIDYAEHTDLVDILDALAREVIYSDRPLLRTKYTVSALDSLASLSERHRVNPELIAAVNQMGQSQALVPNTQIKLIDGPFRAQVSLARGELTLFLRKMYAGRFPVSISQKNKPEPGTYEIVDRRRDRTFYSANAVIPAEAPTNPYGGYWLSLGANLAIHGSPEQVTSELEGVGCISLAPLDAADVYRILSKGAAVEIRP